MNEQPVRLNARAERDRETAESLADIGITPSEASLFNVVHYGLTAPPRDLCRRATSRDYSIGSPATAESIQSALADGLAKGWLQIVDEAVLGRLQGAVRRGELLGPIYGYPTLGGVDFTDAGAEKWFHMCGHLWNAGRAKSFAYCDVVHEKTARFFLSKAKAEAERDACMGWENTASVTGPFRIGPWRANWWRRFAEGYRIDVEERMQWQGRSSSGGGCIFFNLRNLSTNRGHAEDVLNRHNVSWVEWLVLASLESATDRHGIAREAIENSKRFGINLGEQECFNGLETCLQNGWLRQIDEQVTAEISSLLRVDPTRMPVCFDPANSVGEIDFTSEGAVLYRMISAEIFGRDWEDGLVVEASYFREEHRYCATEVGLEAVRQVYAESGQIPTTIRTTPIGPWCVYWWERFCDGYRMELTFGEP